MAGSRLVIGLMSGTSLDGIDAVLLRVKGHGTSVRFRQLAYLEKRFPVGVRSMLLRNSVPGTSRVDEIALLNVLLAHLYADAARAVARKGGVSLSRVDLIGSHGQTIQHLPRPRRMFGKTIRATLQIGNPSVLSALTGVTTVGDFRLADMAVGGQGAPLVPYLDWLIFRSVSKNRLLLNIGGIANVTALPRSCKTDNVVAFDTGPGNMVVDGLMGRLFGTPYDRNGETARRGSVVHDLLRWMIRNPYLRRKPPKSTGREEFGEGFVDGVLARAKGRRKEDIVATASFFTGFAVFEGYRRFIEKSMRVDELLVSGGGARNGYLMKLLRTYFGDGKVRRLDSLGISSDAKEAICFGILASEAIHGVATNIPSVTGARKKLVLGTVCPPG